MPLNQGPEQHEAFDAYYEIHEAVSTFRETIWQGIEISADDFANALSTVDPRLVESFGGCVWELPELSPVGVRRFNEMAAKGNIEGIMRILHSNFNQEFYFSENEYPDHVLRMFKQIKRDLRVVHYADITPEIGKGIFTYEGRNGAREVYTWNVEQIHVVDPLDIGLDEAEKKVSMTASGYYKPLMDLVERNRFKFSPNQIDHAIDIAGINEWSIRSIVAYQNVDRFHLIRIQNQIGMIGLDEAIKFAKNTNPTIGPDVMDEFEITGR